MASWQCYNMYFSNKLCNTFLSFICFPVALLKTYFWWHDFKPDSSPLFCPHCFSRWSLPSGFKASLLSFQQMMQCMCNGLEQEEWDRQCHHHHHHYYYCSLGLSCTLGALKWRTAWCSSGFWQRSLNLWWGRIVVSETCFFHVHSFSCRPPLLSGKYMPSKDIMDSIKVQSHLQYGLLSLSCVSSEKSIAESKLQPCLVCPVSKDVEVMAENSNMDFSMLCTQDWTTEPNSVQIPCHWFL